MLTNQTVFLLGKWGVTSYIDINKDIFMLYECIDIF